jgi:hypothetical protein
MSAPGSNDADSNTEDINMTTDTRDPHSRDIDMFFHCAQCISEIPRGQSMAQWARLSVGDTPYGFQVWCERHHVSVLRVNLPSHVGSHEDAPRAN